LLPSSTFPAPDWPDKPHRPENKADGRLTYLPPRPSRRRHLQSLAGRGRRNKQARSKPVAGVRQREFRRGEPAPDCRQQRRPKGVRICIAIQNHPALLSAAGIKCRIRVTSTEPFPRYQGSASALAERPRVFLRRPFRSITKIRSRNAALNGRNGAPRANDGSPARPSVTVSSANLFFSAREFLKVCPSNSP
jgi:hypothetical protein